MTDSSLVPSQMAAFESLLGSWEAFPLVHLWCDRGRGRTTILRALQTRLGGRLLSMAEFAVAQRGAHPLAIEDSLMRLLDDALAAHDRVYLDDWHLIGDVVESCYEYPRRGYLGVIAAAIAQRIATSGKRLLIASDAGLPESLREQARSVGVEEFDAEDYRRLCERFAGEKAQAIDYAAIHRFAPRLNCHQLRASMESLSRSTCWSTDAFRDYLHENQLASNVSLPEVAPVSLEDLVGMDDVIESLLANVVFPMENDEYRQAYGLVPKRGVLLLGPPGTGKTTIGKALAHRLRGKFFIIDGTVISGTERFYHTVNHIFHQARENAPAVIFIDDSDVIFESQREHGLYRYLLTMLDGLESKSASRVCVIMTAMAIKHIPPALIRSGRVELWLETRYPDSSGRAHLIDTMTRGLPAELLPIDVERIAEASEHCSAADLKRLLNDAKTRVAWLRFREQAALDLTTAFLDAIDSYRALKAKYVDNRRERDQKGERPVWFSVPMGES
ncbi:ATP-dependent zinc metalloprotease FtsH [Caulifigura coniformis]|uniref:ATP-dependent zinc metalloprotease FtsH n=1 Tax=Caulifigura coniformis TaxID=2527983 RepID=A0A517S9X7_9PLAN|nr:ATP-binding protein [Caulifigura coniformis]QDT52922.1 ATP-dependent zinc metalloprotease FtsH [Caulifigura coniformis]